jgi:hypothetical protein
MLCEVAEQAKSILFSMSWKHQLMGLSQVEVLIAAMSLGEVDGR